VAVFELGGALAPALPELAIGPWMPAPPGPPGMTAFDAGAGPPESLWRVDLARDDAAGRAALAGGARSVARTHAVLDDIPRRFDRALAELSVLARPDRPGPARGDRGATPAEALPLIEARLVAALARAEVQVPSQPDEPPPRLPGVPGASRSSASEPGRLERALQCAGNLARGRARIETHVERALVARSITTLSGGTELWIAPGLSRTGAELHARSVAVALRTRHAWARILVLVVGCGGRLVALGPAGAVAAVPLVWGFLRDVLHEVRDLTPG
jgi:hypothetical protein